jgi:uncharacterized membrane protein YdjX (TVP38/TMEM64 family)
MATPPLAGDSGGRRAAAWRVALYGALIGTAVIAGTLTGALPTPEEVRDWGEKYGDWAPLVYVPVFALVNLAIPWPILAGAGGLLFGTAAATPLALFGVTLAALLQMAIARRLAGSHAGGLLPKRTRAVEDFLTRNGTVAVMESRIVPLLPYGVVNFSAGLTRLRFSHMALGTVIGAAPKVFVYTALGGSLADIGSPEAIVAIVLWVVLALGGLLFVKRQVASERGPASA